MVMFTGYIDEGWNGGDEPQSYTDYVASQVPYGAGGGGADGAGFILPPAPLPNYNPAPEFITPPAPQPETVPVTQPALKLEADDAIALQRHETTPLPVTEQTSVASVAAPSPTAQVTAALSQTQKTALAIGGAVLLLVVVLYLFMPKKKAA